MIYRITFGFRGVGQGWSETHSCLNGSGNPNDLVPTMRDIAQKRANFLGAPFVLNAVRIARFYDEVAAARSRGSKLIKENFTAQNPTSVGDAEPADVALISRGTPNVAGNPALAQYAGNQNQTFLGGPPDSAVSLAGVVNLGAAGLGGAFAAWRSAMIAASMGWLAVSRADFVDINAAIQNTNGTVTYTLARDVVPDLTGQTTTVRVSGINNGRSSLNGPQEVEWLSADNPRTRFVRAFSVLPVGGKMRVYNPTPVHLSFLDIALELQTGQHDRGRPFGSSRGRQAREVRG